MTPADIVGTGLLIVLIVFGVKVVGWLYDDDKFTPNFFGRHKTKTPSTRSKEQ